ncbi:MAG TPA: SDR family NAD(P)-dependent oxidoreductase [Candidatus Nanoarchaeia archaeon]|nr:SDR family NAD(P)-dependent oxidoreductase [Candidatus Nanoarchaeia archaeon]
MKEAKPVSLVTGASSGLGRELAEILCFNGHKVYVVARRKNLLEELSAECKNHSGEIILLPGDLSKIEFRKKIIPTIIKREGKIDYLFNNAGFGRATLLEGMESEEIRNMLEVNVNSYIHLANEALKYMKKANQGRIINVGSVVTFTPLPYFTVYNATKSAVYSFNRSLRYELKNSKVTSTVVLPARMKTDFAKTAFHCSDRETHMQCVEKFNKIAGSPRKVAFVIVKNMDKGKEVITPTFKAKIWYFMRYFGFAVDFAMKNVLGPKQLKDLKRMR